MGLAEASVPTGLRNRVDSLVGAVAARRERRAPRCGVGLAIALSLAAAGCGGGGGSSQPSGTSGASGAAASPSAAARCLRQAGFPTDFKIQHAKKTLATVYINEDQLNQVYLAFMETPAAAEQARKGLEKLATLTGGKSGVEVVGGTIVLGRAKRSTDAEVNRVRGCLTE